MTVAPTPALPMQPSLLPTVTAGLAALLANVCALAQGSTPPALAPRPSAPTPHLGMQCPEKPEYPLAALRAQATGTTRVAGNVQADGRITDVHIIGASGPTREHAMLDQAALLALQHCRFDVPSAMAGRMPVTQPIEYVWRLEADRPVTPEELAQLQVDATAGDPRSQYALALALAARPPKAPGAEERLHSAAASGPQALASALTAEGVQQPEAGDWLQKAAAAGLVAAQYDLARWYMMGLHVPRDDAKSVEWLERAAAAGHAPAQLALAYAVRSGRGTTSSDTRYVELLRSASAGRSAVAMRLLGDAYAAGTGVSVDAASAMDWYRRAARLNDASSFERMGALVDAGRDGIDADPAQALAYFRLAQQTGSATAKSRAEAVARRLDDAQLARAAALVSAWHTSQEASPSAASGAAAGR